MQINWRVVGGLAAARLLIGLVLLAGGAQWFSRAEAADPALRETGQQLMQQSGEAVITVRAVLAVGTGGSAQEMKMESPATVIGPDGLTIVSLAGIDPASVIRRMAGEQVAAMLSQLNTRVKDLKLILADKKEIPATVVLRDNDLMVAFIRPLEAPAEPMPHVDLTASADAELLDEIVTLARLGMVGDRQLSLEVSAVSAKITRPRMFYVPGGTTSSFGVPVFTGEGRLLGIQLLRVIPGGLESMMGSLLGDFGDTGMLPIILPAADVLEVAEQAPQEGEKIEEEPAVEESEEDVMPPGMLGLGDDGESPEEQMPGSERIAPETEQPGMDDSLEPGLPIDEDAPAEMLELQTDRVTTEALEMF